mmetsp:Transcript_143372/g.458259  ORF Transcript_143372/g.458259 Transcript_143372/m.458259 type:complete len:439 (-) Transcript_143372:424-1740(-)
MEAVAATAVAAAAGLAWLKWSRLLKVEEPPHEWMFTALAHSRKDIVLKGDPDMSWNEVHPRFGTPLHSIGAAGICLKVEGHPTYDWTLESAACIKDLFSLFEFALQRGADPNVVCPRTCTGSIKFVVKDIYDLQEPVAGRSPISLWLALSQRAQAIDGERPLQLPLASSLFDGVLALLLHRVPKHRGLPRRLGGPGAPAMVDVPEATTGLWQRIMCSEDSADVVLACPDGEVLVHSAVVASASKVLSAMLRWPRQEQASGELVRVPLQDSHQAVEAWRVMIYTGLPPQEGLSTQLLLEVFEISHRWQDHLLDCGLLAAALARRVVDAETCKQVLEMALTRDLPELRAECLAFARRSREVRRAWEEGFFEGEATRHLQLVLCHGSSIVSRNGSRRVSPPSPGHRRRAAGSGGGLGGSPPLSPERGSTGGRGVAAGRWDL